MSPRVRHQAERILESLRVRSGKHHASVEQGASHAYSDAKTGIAARIPAGWSVDGQQLTMLGDPRQVFAASSYRVQRHEPDQSCAPKTAVGQAKTGALVFVLEDQNVRRRARREYPPRPARFRLAASRYLPHECFGYAYEWNFRDRQRFFKVLVYSDPKRSGRATRGAAERVVESLRFAKPRPTVASAKLRLDRPPFLGIACGKANSKASARKCDRVGIAIWPRGRFEAISVAIGGSRARLHRINGDARYWVGSFHPAGLRNGVLALPRGGGDRWEGEPPVVAMARITAVDGRGRKLSARRRVRLGPGFG